VPTMAMSSAHAAKMKSRVEKEAGKDMSAPGT
jgi:hypothetical protein